MSLRPPRFQKETVMRPLETTLLIWNVAQLALLVMPMPSWISWIRHSAAVGLVIVAAHVLAEGTRWQMLPAYGVSLLFGLLWLAQLIGRSSTLPISCSGAIRILTALLGVSITVLSVALPLAFPVFHIPSPTGPYAIGTLTYHWTDASRAEVFSADPGDARSLMAQVWYPATSAAASPKAPYIADARAFSQAQAALHSLPDFIFAHLEYAAGNAVSAAALSESQPKYPILIFLEGLTGYRQMNTFQVEELVSHGYIVVALDQPYVAASVVFPDRQIVFGLSKDQIDPLIQQSILPIEQTPRLHGVPFEEGIIPYLSSDVLFALDQLEIMNRADPMGILTGALDLSRVGVFGISIGGIVASEACRSDARLIACLVMDAPMPAIVEQDGLTQPALWITRDAATMQAEGWTQPDIDQHQSTMRGAFNTSHGDRYFLRVPGMFHANLMDAPFFSPFVDDLGITGPINPQRAHQIINAYSLAFFNRHVKGQHMNMPDELRLAFPEVILEQHPGN